MHHHAHGYLWVGPGRLLAAEGDRRPENRERFAASDLPPMITADWLRKPARLVRATFTGPAGAVAWLSDHFEQYRPQQLHPALNTGAPPLAVRVRNAERTLAHGGDVSWGWWLKGERFVSLAAVSCPGRRHYATPPPCPADPRRP